ncbi:MAG: alanine racemase [Desulfobacterales bacterium]|nr:alanine racemase [Desulfobacterales bacterium]
MEVLVHLEKIRENLATIRGFCRQAGLQPVWITKGCQAYDPILSDLTVHTDEVLGDVRPANLARLRRAFSGKVMRVQISGAQQAGETVRSAHTTLISHPAHARWLGKAAGSLGITHDLIFMIDVGNRREGALPVAVSEMVREVAQIPHVCLVGLGASVGCYGGYRAGLADLERLVATALGVRNDTGLALDVLSVGSGTMLLDLVRQGRVPAGITQLRIGAAVWVGEMPPTRTAIDGLHQDAFCFCGEILESGLKPSLPEGQTGTDAFGRQVVFENAGDRHLVLMNFGMVDVDAYDLTPLEAGVRVIGATSNYTICDVTDAATAFSVGSVLTFRMGYSAMVRAMSSTETVKTVVG